MYKHIPEEIFCTQVNGQVDEALKILNVKLKGFERKSCIFDHETLASDPENPITQVSKTPSDEDIAIEWHSAHFDEPEEFSENARLHYRHLSAKRRLSSALLSSDSEDSQMESTDGKNDVHLESTAETDSASTDPAASAVGETGTAFTSSGYMIQAFEDIPIQLKTKSKLKEEDVVTYIAEMKRKVAAAGPGETIFPSNAACRFEVPIDARSLKDVTPLSYVSKYCVVSDNRRTIYAKKFVTYCQDANSPSLSVPLLQKIYENSFKIPVLKEEIAHLTRLLDIDRKAKLDADDFIKISCLMERIILKSQRRGPDDAYIKNYIEEADFSALKGKLDGIEMSAQLYSLLEYIKQT